MARSLLDSISGLHTGTECDPAAARMAGGVVRALLAEGAHDDVAAFLAPTPDGRATFELRSGTRPVGANGSARRLIPFGEDLEGAVRQALRMVSAGDLEVELWAVSGRLRRRAMRASRSGRPTLEWVPPSAASLDGDPVARRAALETWRRRGAPVAETGEVPVVDLTGPPAAAAAPIDPDTVRSVLAEAFADVALEVDASSVEAAVRSALTGADNGSHPAGAPGEIARKADLDHVESAMRQSFGVLGAEMHHLTNALQVWDPGKLAERVAAVLSSELPQPGSRPAPAGRGASDGSWMAESTLQLAADQLHLQLQSFEERVRSAGRSLEGLAEELASRDRTAAEISEQLARRIEEMLDALARRSGTEDAPGPKRRPRRTPGAS